MASFSSGDIAGIVVVAIFVITMIIIHCMYGVRCRCMKLSQKTNEMLEDKPLLQPSVTSSRVIKILSQNIWCVFGIGGPNRKERLKLFIDGIDDDEPDIICLQEMNLFGIGFLMLCGDYLYVQQQLIKKGYIYYTDPKLSCPYFGSSSGLIIFSKYPIIECSTNIFKNRRCARYKGWIFARIALFDKNTLSVINTHLEHRNEAMMFHQIEEIVSHKNINHINNNDKDHLLCLGDFNICSNNSFGGTGYNKLCQQMSGIGLNHDLFAQTERTYSKSFVRHGKESLDHVFIDDKLKQIVKNSKLIDYRDDKRIVSDHLALITTFQFNQYL